MVRATGARPAVAVLALLVSLAAETPAAALVEVGPVRPLALSAAGDRLFAANIPDDRLEIFAVTDAGLAHLDSVRVGLAPVAVAVRSDTEVWVVNHLSDSVSIVDVGAHPARVVRTLLVGDEPSDIVFAGPDRSRAFITTAHRGQNSPIDPQLDTPGIGRADVWVFETEKGTDLFSRQRRPGESVPPRAKMDLSPFPPALLGIVTLFGDTPRALAVSPDGATVYAAVFKSGNRTTIVNAIAVCDGGEPAPPCRIQGRDMPGGLPAPNVNLEGITQPETGLIVKYNSGAAAWEDELGRNWNNAIPISLPDSDVFAIDAMADPPVESNSYSGVGTILYNMAVNPVSRRVYVSNTEARNQVRFEPVLRGHLHESRITVLDGDAVAPRHLNKHIDYDVVPSPPGVREHSLATPLDMAVSADGSTLYVAAFGSAAIGVFQTAELEDDTFVPGAGEQIPTGGGPCGLVLDEARQRLYILTRFDNRIAAVALQTRQAIQHVDLHTPEPASVRDGRRFLYDARHTSSNGETSCASCHVFGGDDGLAWDLGDPNGVVVENPNPRNPIISDLPIFDLVEDFHPLKGPMTTQSLRGLAGHGQMHWRGDRTGGVETGGELFDERAAFHQFNPAFATLLGRYGPLSPAEMDAFADFILGVVPPPNPIRPLDNSLTPVQAASRAEFFGDDTGACANCHAIDPSRGVFGTDLTVTSNGQTPQLMRVPDLREAYQKVGMFGLFPQLSGFLPSGFGDQIRGFGFINDGSSGVFVTRAFDYVMAFDTNLAPIVGQQVTLTPSHDEETVDALEDGPSRRRPTEGGSSGRAEDSFRTNPTTARAEEAPSSQGPSRSPRSERMPAAEGIEARLDLLVERARAGECDLIVRGVVDGEGRSWHLTDAGLLQGDRAAEAPRDESAVRALVGIATEALTYTCVPPGEGIRAGVDRDADGAFDADERTLGTNPTDPHDPPGTGACTGGPLGPRFRLRVLGNNAPPRARRLKLVADFSDPQSSVLGPDSSVLIGAGLRFAISSADGRELAYGIAPPGDAWLPHRSGEGWTYTASADTPGGISRAVVALDPETPGRLRVKLRATNLGYQFGPADLPLNVTVQLGGPPQGLAGHCGRSTAELACRLSPSQGVLRCR